MITSAPGPMVVSSSQPGQPGSSRDEPSHGLLLLASYSEHSAWFTARTDWMPLSVPSQHSRARPAGELVGWCSAGTMCLVCRGVPASPPNDSADPGTRGHVTNCAPSLSRSSLETANTVPGQCRPLPLTLPASPLGLQSSLLDPDHHQCYPDTPSFHIFPLDLCCPRYPSSQRRHIHTRRPESLAQTHNDGIAHPTTRPIAHALE